MEKTIHLQGEKKCISSVHDVDIITQKIERKKVRKRKRDKERRRRNAIHPNRVVKSKEFPAHESTSKRPTSTPALACVTKGHGG